LAKCLIESLVLLIPVLIIAETLAIIESKMKNLLYVIITVCFYSCSQTGLVTDEKDTQTKTELNMDTSIFECTECGKTHTGWPVLAFESPTYYHLLSEQDKLLRAELNSNFCIVRNKDITHFFIRATLIQKVINSEKHLEYSLWISLSEDSFNGYKRNLETQILSSGCFGWLNTPIPGYDPSINIPMNVYFSTNGKIPVIEPHNDFECNLVRDYLKGISSHEAQRRVDEMMEKL
jgi:hypothetical protein